jgi:uncharacterized membrane protein YadS
MVQCLLVAWFALLTASTHSLNLQARMFKYVYGVSVEMALSERKKKKKGVIRIESELLFYGGGLMLYTLLTSWSHTTTPRHERAEDAGRQEGLLVR